MNETEIAPPLDDAEQDALGRDRGGRVTEMPTAAVLATWRSGWFDLNWRESVDRAWKKEPIKMARLLDSIRAEGIREPILLGSDGRIWDGHHRLSVACRLGLPVVPVKFAALELHIEDGCATCGLPTNVHALWCPHRPGPPETADDVLSRVHLVFATPELAWFADQFWASYALTGKAGDAR